MKGQDKLYKAYLPQSAASFIRQFFRQLYPPALSASYIDGVLMKELRCLVFSEQEVIAALIERRRRLHEALPEGMIKRVIYTNDKGVSVTIHATGANEADNNIVAQEQEVTAALVNYCMTRKIPMPVNADKYLQVIKDGLTLMITLRFNRSHKAAQGDDQGAGDSDNQKTGPQKTSPQNKGGLSRIAHPVR
ncbi:MAG: hypothetical protein WCK65_10335 [Rhodospirillaceae bacterium]